jgi:hypothetical protein
MNISRRSLLLGFAALVLAGCASKPDLTRIEDPDVDFPSYFPAQESVAPCGEDGAGRPR